MDVKTQEMNGALDNVYSTSIDNGEVMNLLNEMKDMQQMEVNGQVAAGSGEIAAPQSNQAAAANDFDAMQAKINELKNL